MSASPTRPRSSRRSSAANPSLKRELKYDHEAWRRRNTTDPPMDGTIYDIEVPTRGIICVEINRQTLEHWELKLNDQRQYHRITNKPLPLRFALDNDGEFRYASISDRGARHFRENKAYRDEETGELTGHMDLDTWRDKVKGEGGAGGSQAEGDDESGEASEESESQAEPMDVDADDSRANAMADSPAGELTQCTASLEAEADKSTPADLSLPAVGKTYLGADSDSSSPLTDIEDASPQKSMLSSPETSTSPLPGMTKPRKTARRSPPLRSSGAKSSAKPRGPRAVASSHDADDRRLDYTTSEEEEEALPPPRKRRILSDAEDDFRPQNVSPLVKKERPLIEEGEGQQSYKKSGREDDGGKVKRPKDKSSSSSSKGKERARDKEKNRRDGEASAPKPPRAKPVNREIKSTARPSAPAIPSTALPLLASHASKDLAKVPPAATDVKPQVTTHTATSSGVPKITLKKPAPAEPSGAASASVPAAQASAPLSDKKKVPNDIKDGASSSAMLSEKKKVPRDSKDGASASATPASKSSIHAKVRKESPASMPTADDTSAPSKKSKLSSTTVTPSASLVKDAAPAPSPSPISASHPEKSAVPSKKSTLSTSTMATVVSKDISPASSPAPAAAADKGKSAASSSTPKASSSLKHTPSSASALKTDSVFQPSSSKPSAASKPSPAASSSGPGFKKKSDDLRKTAMTGSGSGTPMMKKVSKPAGPVDIISELLGTKTDGPATAVSGISSSGIKVHLTEKEQRELEQMRKEHEEELAAFEALPGMRKPLDIEGHAALLRERSAFFEAEGKKYLRERVANPTATPFHFTHPHEVTGGQAFARGVRMMERRAAPPPDPSLSREEAGLMPFPRSKAESESFRHIWVAEMEGKWDDPEALKMYLANPKYSNTVKPRVV